jgi:hypothetical protein
VAIAALSGVKTTIVAGVVGGLVAVGAAAGVVQSQQSAGDSPVDASSVSYDGS